MQESFGSVVRRIAFANREIFASAAKLAARGCPALQIGDNYHDDVEARFGLDPALTARLRTARILYGEGSGRAVLPALLVPAP